jgi:hypothetical protein
MIVAVDIETRSLDATQYLTGCVLGSSWKKPEIYRNKNDLWERIKALGIQEGKRDKVLSVYSHNAQYDTAGYVDLTDKHLVLFSQKPFIWAYRLTSDECDEFGVKHLPNKGKEIIKFLDTWAIFHMPLKDLGLLINLPKQETPASLFETSKEMTEEDLKLVETYMVRDCEIVIQALSFLKQKLKNEGIVLKRLYTINQIAIQYLLHNLANLPDEQTKDLFWDKSKNEIRRTFREVEIHEAYRGGRVEAFQTGVFTDVNYRLQFALSVLCTINAVP